MVLGFLSEFGLTTRIGIWIVFAIVGFQLLRALKIGHKASDWVYYVAIGFFAIAIGLASGILTGVNVQLAMDIIQMIITMALETVEKVLP